MNDVTIKELLDAGIHFGHRTNRWNPKMAEYIYGHRNGIHIIDLQQTVTYFQQALKAVSDFAEEGKNILFVGTKRQASEIIEKYAVECNQYFINKRWLGGMLTNLKTVKQSIKRLHELEKIIDEGGTEKARQGNIDEFCNEKASTATKRGQGPDKTSK